MTELVFGGCWAQAPHHSPASSDSSSIPVRPLTDVLGSGSASLRLQVRRRGRRQGRLRPGFWGTGRGQHMPGDSGPWAAGVEETSFSRHGDGRTVLLVWRCHLPSCAPALSVQVAPATAQQVWHPLGPLSGDITITLALCYSLHHPAFLSTPWPLPRAGQLVAIRGIGRCGRCRTTPGGPSGDLAGRVGAAVLSRL